MASVYTRKASRFWWIKYRHHVTGKAVRESTKIDVAIPDARRKAKKLEAEKTRLEMSVTQYRETERWEAWAAQFIAAKYAGTGSLRNATLAIDDLLAYFRDAGISAPRQVDYDNANAFQAWRASGKVLAPIGKNTIKLRFIYFSVLMREAVRRGFCESNICREVTVSGEPSKSKKEITPEDEKKIVAALVGQPEWQREQWTVLMCQGCRIAESNPPLDRIDTEAGTIIFKLKGGKMHIANLHPDLLPIVAKARSAGRATLLNAPAVASWSSIWGKFFKRLGLPYSAHCTRVTVITRLVRANHPVVKICNFIGHTEEVNRIYRKLKPADSLALMATLGASAIPS